MWSTPARALRIATSAGGYLGWLCLRRFGWIEPAESPAERFARTLERLGTTFIKVGQALVLRRDLLPESYVFALQRLQDHVVGFAPALARAEVEQASGRPLKALFEEFEDLPLAAASVAQVHRARLTDGTAVIVKVRRPGIVAVIERDMRLLRLAVRVALLAMPGLRRFRPLEIVAEIHANLRRETDFRLEARNALQLRRAFEGRDTVMVPAVFEGLCTESVMVQELSGGQRIDDPALRPIGKGLAAVLVDAYLYQFFTLGMFHADPHGGNLFHTPAGRICLHDFGMVGFLNLDTRRNLAALMQAFVNQDADWMLDASLAVGLLGGSIDRDSFRAGLEEILRDYAHLPLKDWSFAEALLRIAALGRGHNLRIPHDLLLLMRAVFLLEHAVRTLDPEYDLVDGLLAKAPVALKATLKLRRGNLARLEHEALQGAFELPETAARWLYRLRRAGPSLGLRVDGLRTLGEDIERSSNRVALALVTLGLYIAASLLMQHSLGPQLWGVPLLALIGYLLALVFTVRLVRVAGRRL